jgi:hypothetical protein
MMLFIRYKPRFDDSRNEIPLSQLSFSAVRLIRGMPELL